MACVEALGNWMVNVGFFLEDQYLKYLGWQCNDKVCQR